MEKASIILRTVCPDRPGLVSQLTSWISNYGGNIKHSDHHTDQDAGLFLSRIEWNRNDLLINKLNKTPKILNFFMKDEFIDQSDIDDQYNKSGISKELIFDKVSMLLK